MERKYDREFYSPIEEPAPPPEDAVVTEYTYPVELPLVEEPAFPVSEYPDASFGDSVRAEEKRPRKKKRSLTVTILSLLATMSLTFASFGVDPFGISSSVKIAESADVSFPALSNLTPNGSVPGYGVLDEEFVALESKSAGTVYLHAGAAYGITPGAPPAGISYDEASNTVTLTNFTGDVLNVNLMGNGFKLNLEGENRLDQLLIWGFAYGGSVLITGTGSLTVNEDLNCGTGIYLKAENSKSCLMIDRDVTVVSYGTDYAVLIEETKMDKAIYYLSPLELSGGTRSKYDSLAAQGGTSSDYTVIDSEGVPATYVEFSKP